MPGDGLGLLGVAEHHGVALAGEAGAANPVGERGAPSSFFGLRLELDFPKLLKGEELRTGNLGNGFAGGRLQREQFALDGAGQTPATIEVLRRQVGPVGLVELDEFDNLELCPLLGAQWRTSQVGLLVFSFEGACCWAPPSGARVKERLQLMEEMG